MGEIYADMFGHVVVIGVDHAKMAPFHAFSSPVRVIYRKTDYIVDEPAAAGPEKTCIDKDPQQPIAAPSPLEESMPGTGLAQTVADALTNTGSAYLSIDDSLFTTQEWRQIEDIIFHPGLPWKKVTVGDADEPNNVYVRRFMTDIDRPRLVNETLGRELLAMLGSERILAFFRDVLKTGHLFIRRVQVNRMEVGSFVGLHLDQDSNPDYEISIVLQVGRSFSGGEFVVHADEPKRHRYVPAYRSMLISRCDLPHEVREVTAGASTSLVFFLSRHDGGNRRQPLALDAA